MKNIKQNFAQDLIGQSSSKLTAVSCSKKITEKKLVKPDSLLK